MPRKRRKRVAMYPKGFKTKQNEASRKNAEEKKQLQAQKALLETDVSDGNTFMQDDADPAWTWGDFLLGVENEEAATPSFDPELQDELEDSDGARANGFLLVIDGEAYPYGPEDDVDMLATSLISKARYKRFKMLKAEVKAHAEDLASLVMLPTPQPDILQLASFYVGENPGIKFVLTIKCDLTFSLTVHRKHISFSGEHDFYFGLPRCILCLRDLQHVLSKLKNWKVCVGNPDENFQTLVPEGVPKCSKDFSKLAYREVDMGACYNSTIRSAKCSLLIRNNDRCSHCSLYRKTLWKRHSRNSNKSELTDKSILSSHAPIRGNITKRKRTENQVDHTPLRKKTRKP